MRLRASIGAKDKLTEHDPIKYVGEVRDDGSFTCRPRHVHLLPRVTLQGIIEDAEGGCRVCVYPSAYKTKGYLFFVALGVPFIFLERFKNMLENPSLESVLKALGFWAFCAIVLSMPLLLEWHVDKRSSLHFLMEILHSKD